MKRALKKWFSWRLKLILAIGCLGGLVLVLFGQYVASISDTPIGPTPLSWKFKSNSARVATAFETGLVMQKQGSDLLPPAIDQMVPEETTLALFALG